MSQVYLLTALSLFALQAFFTFNAFGQIRFEEVYESVKAVYFWEHQQVISGLHTNVGWYTILLLAYKIFGFSLHTGQIVKLVISFFSLLSLALLFSKYFKNYWGLIPFVAIATSPTLMYYNTLNLHNGIDLQLLPIALLILTSIKIPHFRSSRAIAEGSSQQSQLKQIPRLDSLARNDNIRNYILTALLFSFLMFAALIYPAFSFYIPALGLFFLYKLNTVIARNKVTWQSVENKIDPHVAKAPQDDKRVYLLIATIAFLLPLIGIFAYTQNREILIFDEVNNSGLFRGGGKIVFSEEVFKQGFDGLFRDLFVKAGSYHFEAGSVDFSDLYPVVSLIFSLYVTFKIFAQDKSSQKIIALIWLTVIANLFIISVTSDYGIPGIRRATPTLACLYGFFVLAWYYVLQDRVKLPVSKTVAICLLSLITIHNVLVLPQNFSSLKLSSPFKMADWFDGTNDPQESLDAYLDELQQGDLVLDCSDLYEPNPNCEYTFVYSAISGSCIWNNLSCHAIKNSDGEKIEFEDLLEK